MVLTKEQSQTRFLAILLPALTLCTHTLLALSFALPGSEQAFWSFVYNLCAAGASIFGLFGAVKLIPSFVSAYTLMHTSTLSFVTLALANIIIPFDAGFLNPVIPSWHVDENAICRDIDAGFGWDEEWLVKCSRNFYTVMSVVAWSGLFLMFAQWWALWTVRRWGKELRFLRLRDRTDVEKRGMLGEEVGFMSDDKTRL
ncbi:hypothetical protein FB567DRAFT_608837 [Paraphoma chrysanthemicola]|uniref:Uncharacterized protein n=1 Tax=Paraphoma chrysanthemicola TaxID=798071 RepID=A0A8K0QXK5_9PLEO|nr:hypothetical protein FB567DRAFT_608837 [Paraphoma chrysanthemicola]